MCVCQQPDYCCHVRFTVRFIRNTNAKARADLLFVFGHNSIISVHLPETLIEFSDLLNSFVQRINQQLIKHFKSRKNKTKKSVFHKFYRFS